MADVDIKYHKLSSAIINGGYTYRDTSRDVDCIQLSSANIEFGLTKEFPLLTTKKMFTKGIVAELIWFLRGLDNIEYLNNNGVHIWDKDSAVYHERHNLPGSGDVGRNYGVQWRRWQIKGVNDDNAGATIDQISNLLNNLKERPINRRNVVTAWNPAELEDTALPPCHWAFEIIAYPLSRTQRFELLDQVRDFSHTEYIELEQEFIKSHEGDEEASQRLDKMLEGIETMGFVLKWHQRSVDTFLGLPFNIASYGLLAHLIEGLTGYKAMGIIADLSNVHFYETHIDLINQQMLNRPDTHQGCTFKFSDKMGGLFLGFREEYITFDEFISKVEIEDFIFEDYNCFEPIKGEMLAPTT